MQIWPPTLENVQGLNPIVDEIILLDGEQNKNYHEVEGGEPGLYFAKSWIQPRMVVVVVPPRESIPMNF